MEAVILAGGRGTRLQPYTQITPKPLVPVAGIPIIELLIRQLVRCEIKKIHICLSEHSAQIETALGDGSRFGTVLRYSIEDRPLSTVGPLKLIADLPDNFIAVNGDILTDIDYRTVYRRHIETRSALTVVTCQRDNTVDFGVIETGTDGLVVGFSEKPSQTFSVSAGIYVYSRRILDHVPDGRAYGFDLMIADLLDKGEPVSSYHFDGYWLDIGRPDDYERANLEIRHLPHLMP